jgi:plasmid maintenance system antidote protein VapI
MARPPPQPGSLLGATLQSRRAGRPSTEVAPEIGVTHTTWLRLERGTNRPTYDTAVKLAAWLGWTTDQVMEAAARPAPAAEPTLPQEE